MKIAVCDDEPKDISQIKKLILLHSSKHEVLSFTSAQLFLERIVNGESFDVLFLDVQMSDANGWDIAKRLKQTKTKLFIAMVTVHGEYIFDCFDRVDWFAPKPITKEKVFKILDKAEEKLYPVVFQFQSDNHSIALSAPEIIYFEVQRNDLFIHTTHQTFKVRLTLKSVREMMAPYSQFVQVHNSYIINLDYFDRLEKGMIFLKSHDEIKLSRTYRSLFFSSLDEYVRNI